MLEPRRHISEQREACRMRLGKAVFAEAENLPINLLCEFALRMEVAELGRTAVYELPITQEQLADAVALTSVHVNRTLMKLERDGLITRQRRMITVVDWKKMVTVADFEPRYLHIGEAAGRVPDEPARVKA